MVSPTLKSKPLKRVLIFTALVILSHMDHVCTLL